MCEAIEADEYEQRYTIFLGRGAAARPLVRMVRRPVSMTPDEGTICYVDNGPREGPIPRQAVATFRGGLFKGAKFEPTHWTHWEDRG